MNKLTLNMWSRIAYIYSLVPTSSYMLFLFAYMCIYILVYIAYIYTIRVSKVLGHFIFFLCHLIRPIHNVIHCLSLPTYHTQWFI